jgi:dihydroorotase
MSKKLFKGGEIVTSEGVFLQDLLIENGKIVDFIDPGTEIPDAEVIDCTGKTILPGFIDAHVHFRDFDQAYKADWESESKAAVAGGITTVLDMPNNDPKVVTTEALEAKRKHIAGRSYVNYGFFFGDNGENLDEIKKAKNIAGVKVFTANSTGDMGVSGGLEELFAGTNHKLVFHAEDEDIINENKARYMAEYEGPPSADSREVDPAVHSKIRSPEAAAKAVEGVMKYAKDYQERIHIAHVSTGAEVDIIAANKKFGVTCEVAPHHLLLSESDYETFGAKIKVNPPVRAAADLFEMWKNLKFGVIDIIATDHAPHTIEEKGGKYEDVPAGIPEEDTLGPIFLNAVNDEGLSFEELVKFCCERPTEIFHLEGKGKIEEGYDADLVVVDMNEERKVEREKLFTKCGWSPYEDLMFKGWPVMTFVGGELVYEKGEIVGEAGGKEVKF